MVIVTDNYRKPNYRNLTNRFLKDGYMILLTEKYSVWSGNQIEFLGHITKGDKHRPA
jgi:hypothetical protein